METLLSGIKGIHGEVPTTPGRCSSGKRRDMILRNIMIIDHGDDVCLQLTFKYLPKNTPRLRHPEASHGIDEYDEISGGALPLPRHDFHWGDLRSKGEPASLSRRHHG